MRIYMDRLSCQNIPVHVSISHTIIGTMTNTNPFQQPQQQSTPSFTTNSSNPFQNNDASNSSSNNGSFFGRSNNIAAATGGNQNNISSNNAGNSYWPGSSNNATTTTNNNNTSTRSKTDALNPFQANRSNFANVSSNPFAASTSSMSSGNSNHFAQQQQQGGLNASNSFSVSQPSLTFSSSSNVKRSVPAGDGGISNSGFVGKSFNANTPSSFKPRSQQEQKNDNRVFAPNKQQWTRNSVNDSNATDKTEHSATVLSVDAPAFVPGQGIQNYNDHGGVQPTQKLELAQAKIAQLKARLEAKKAQQAAKIEPKETPFKSNREDRESTAKANTRGSSPYNSKTEVGSKNKSQEAPLIPKKPKHILNPKCYTMCPLNEIQTRQENNEISILEQIHPDVFPSSFTLKDTCVKKFRRSAADVDLAVDNEVRNPITLEKSMAFLEEYVMERDRQGPDPRSPSNSVPDPLDVYQFMWDRTRMLRKDFLLQNVPQMTKHASKVKVDIDTINIAIRVHERITRWHVLCEHQLSHLEDWKQQSNQNIMELGQCLKSLNMLYDERKRLLLTGARCNNVVSVRRGRNFF